MGVLDFLFEGKPPASVTTYGETVQNLPSWLSDYTQGLIARANTVAAEPYQTYGGPRVAGFTPAQTQAHQRVQSNLGIWSPYTNAAQSTLSGVASGENGALQKANPYLTAGTESFTDNVDRYMNPYVENVIDRSTEIAQRKLEEQLLPAIKGNFIKAGAYGSAGQQRAVGRALRDVTGEIQSQANAALSDAYNNASQLQGSEAMRQIQAGQIAGGLGGDDISRQLQAGQNLGALGQLVASLTGADTAALSAMGTDQQALNQRNLDTAYGDFQQQRDYPRQTLDWMSSIIRGMPYSQTQTTTNTGPMGDQYQPSLISQLGSALALYRGIKDEFGKARGGLARASAYAGGGKVKSFKDILEDLRRQRERGEATRRKMYELFPDIERAEREILKDQYKDDKKVKVLPTKKAHGGVAVMRRLNYGR